MDEKPFSDQPLEGSVKITKASYALQDKAGKGEIDPILIIRADRFIEENTEDFTPLALEQMARMARVLERIKLNEHRIPEAIQELVGPVMQLKANGRFFKYDLITSLAEMMLSFLESIDRLDDDVVALVDTHLASVQLIIARKIKGNGGADGKLLLKELEDAIRRYNKKRAVAFQETIN